MLTDGDLGFTGVNELTQPAQLDQGDIAEAQNARFTNNIIETRLGMSKLPWTNRVTNSSTTPLPFTTIYGAVDFRDPNGVEWMIIAADGKVYRTRENNGAAPVALPPGVVITAAVTFTQCFTGLILFRGPDLAPLVMNSLDTGFEPIAQTANTISNSGENPTDGTQVIPNAKNGEWIGNRLFIPYNKDFLAISDYLNPTRYAGVRSQARINQGSEDALVRFFKFNDQSAVVFKERSIYTLDGLTGDLSTMSLDQFTNEYGLAAAKSCVNTGADVWFLAEKRGICSIFQTSQNKFQGRDVPVSQRIKNLIGRINWQYAAGAVAAYYDNKYYLSVPLDDATNTGPELLTSAGSYSGGGTSVLKVIKGATYVWTKGANETSLTNLLTVISEGGSFTAFDSTVTLTGTASAAVTASLKRQYTGVNNAVLAYDFLKQKWAGVDTGSGVMVQEWVRSTYSGARRLFALSSDGFINLYEELPYDEVGSEVIGNNIATGTYPPALTVDITVVAGTLYSYTLGTHDSHLVNGTEVPTSGMFIAQTNEVTFVGVSPGVGINGSLQTVGYAIGVEWIGYDVTLRGYTCGALTRKRFLQGMLQMQTWYPQFTVHVICDGADEELSVVENKTKNFLVYDRPWDKANWNQTNANDDHATPYRQDYALVLSDATQPPTGILPGVTYFVEDLTGGGGTVVYNNVGYIAPSTFVGVASRTSYTVSFGSPVVYPPGSYFIPGNNGINPDQMQEATEKVRFPLSTRGRTVQFRVKCTRGRVSILAASVEAMTIDAGQGSFL